MYLTGCMFVAHQLVIDISSQAAQARLANLAYGYGLSDASQQAHEDGLASLIRVGPLGDLPGASKLVRVRFLDPVYCDDAMTLGLRWETTGVTGALFPVLDADITLTATGEHTTRLALRRRLPAAAWPPGSRAGQGDLEPDGRGDDSRPAAKRRECTGEPRQAAHRHPGTASGPAPRLITEPERPS